MSEATGAGQVRAEDAFDVAAVIGWLRTEHAGSPSLARVDWERAAAGTQVRQFSGGASNLTYLLSLPARTGTGTDGDDGSDRDGVEPVELVLRRPPAGTKAKGAHDMRREHDLQARLKPAFPAVPTMVGYCGDESVIGSDFYLMERVAGVIPRKELPPGVDLGPEQVRRLCENAIDLLVELHAVDLDAAGLRDLGKGEGYVERQLAGWTRRYRDARTRGLRHGTGSFEKVIAWLEANRPPADSGTCLIHNDFRFDNLVLDAADPTRIVGVLDWELATLGDPLMDLGSALAYWVEAGDDPVMRTSRRQPTHLPGMLTRDEVVRYYGERTGRTITADRWAFYEVFGLFRLAGIAQQIYYRYAQGQTTNPAFRSFRALVVYLEWRARRIIRRHPRITW